MAPRDGRAAGAAWRRAWAAAALGILAAAPRADAAWRADELLLSVGRNTLISSDADGGGFAGSVAALWDVEAPVPARFGLAATADDQGSVLGTVVDANDSKIELGTAELLHVAIYSVAWRADAEWPVRGPWVPWASGTWGYYRLSGDQLGEQFAAASAVGFSLAAGLRAWRSERGGPGAFVRYHRVFSELTGRYVTLGVDWQWRLGGAR